MYVPVYIDVYRFFWSTPQGSYGAFMLALVVWLMWRERAVFASACTGRISWFGVGLVVCGLGLYVAGRSQAFYQFELGSQIPLLLGIVRLVMGRAALRYVVAPVVLLVFVIPVPGSVLDEILLPLKQWVSGMVDEMLYAAGYPIARNGVVLTIGRYQLLIADACAGLNSVFALAGVGLVYVHVIARRQRWFNAALICSILPIALFANLVRVTLLALITYYRGDEAGRAFHDQAGYLEILLVFSLFFALDRMLTWGATQVRTLQAAP